MPVRHAKARWEGDVKRGAGAVKLGSGAFEGRFAFTTRFESEPGTNPEELLAAAHAGCFAMALSKILGEAGHPPERIEAQAQVHLDKQDSGFAITQIDLQTQASVPGISQEDFQRYAQQAKEGCLVSKVLRPPISLEAKLVE
ncbi:MAG TPA: OsmC family protein [Phycisphaeraceae bacterium]